MQYALIVVAATAWFSVAGATGAEARAAETPTAEATAQSPAAGGTASAESSGEEAPPRESLVEILRSSGIIGMLILLLSVGAVALVIEHVMTIRASVLMPPGLADDVRALLVSGQVGPADQRCHTQPSFLAHVLGAGLAEVDGGWSAVEKAVEDATAEQSARLFRKIEYLSVIGNIAPMMGLLGTVIGMILAFQKVATTPGVVRPADLAGGIYLALVTTVEGLVVAIPSLAAFAVFRNRVDQLVAEVAYVAQHVFAPLKRNRSAAVRRAPAPPKAPSPPRGPAPPPAGGGGG